MDTAARMAIFRRVLFVRPFSLARAAALSMKRKHTRANQPTTLLLYAVAAARFVYIRINICAGKVHGKFGENIKLKEKGRKEEIMYIYTYTCVCR